MNFYDFSSMESKELAPGVTIQVVPGDRMTMVVFSIKKGAQIPEHSHPHEQMGLVTAGKMKLIVDQKEQVVKPGTAWHIPGNVVHSGECLEDDTVVVEFFSPPREDLVQRQLL